MHPLQPLPAVPFFEHPLGRITHEPSSQFIQLHWQAGPRDAAAVQVIFEQVLLLHQRTACPRLLIDERLAGSFGEGAKQWLVAEWLPHLAQRPGFARVALIVANDAYARLSAITVRAEARQLGLPFNAFATEAEARAWLSQG